MYTIGFSVGASWGYLRNVWLINCICSRTIAVCYAKTCRSRSPIEIRSWLEANLTIWFNCIGSLYLATRVANCQGITLLNLPIHNELWSSWVQWNCLSLVINSCLTRREIKLASLELPLKPNSLSILACRTCSLDIGLVSSSYFCPVLVHTFNRFRIWTTSIARKWLEGYTTCIIHCICPNTWNFLS